MSAYTTREAILTEIPVEHLNQALDDDRDGVADDGLITSLIAAASQEVDALFPGAPTAVASQAALIFACERIYRRRRAEKNPYKEQADAKRKELRELAGGTQIAAAPPTYLERTKTFTRDHQDGI